MKFLRVATSNGTLSLRKLLNDNIVVLGTASLTDTSFPAGRYGLVTYKTVAACIAAVEGAAAVRYTPAR